MGGKTGKNGGKKEGVDEKILSEREVFGHVGHWAIRQEKRR